MGTGESMDTGESELVICQAPLISGRHLRLSLSAQTAVPLRQGFPRSSPPASAHSNIRPLREQVLAEPPLLHPALCCGAFALTSGSSAAGCAQKDSADMGHC